MKKTFLAGVVCLCLTAFVNAQVASGVSRTQFADNWKSLPQQLFDGSSLFFDNFNGDNTVTGLTGRGYVVLNQDGGGTADPFFQGNPTVLTAYEGPTNGYVASNYQGANGFLIDQWLISPPINVTAGDTLSFWHRSPDNNTFDDSIFVRYSTTAGITPAAFDVTWGRYLVSESGWARWTGTFNHTGTIRFAIQYYHTNGGPSGSYSNFIGIDLLEVLSSTAATTARVQVIHNSADVLADSVDVYINGALAINNFAFRTATPFLDLPAGVTLNIGIAPKTSTSVNDTLKNFPVVLTAGEKYTVIANGVLNPALYSANPDGRNTAFTLLIKTMAREVGLGSDVDFFVLHGSTDAPTVDVKAREVGNATLVNDAAYRDITGYLSVPAANYTLDLYLGNGVNYVASFTAPLSGLGGGAAAVFASGFLNPTGNQNGAAFGLFAALPNGTVIQLPAASAPNARVQVIHNSSDVLADSVDVYINGALAINNFAFRTATPFIDLAAGVTLNIGIAPKTSTSVNDTLKNFPVILTANEKYVVIANGVLNPALYAANPDGRNTAFTLFVKPMAREIATGSDVDFFVLHGSTDAPTVDVKAREAGNLTLVNDAAYSDLTAYLSVPPANYTLDLYLANGTTLVNSFIAPLAGLGGGAATVFASGFLNPAANQNGPAFGIFAVLANGTVVQFNTGVVPVELSSFTANIEGNNVTLNWVTSTEVNNRGFEVQRKFADEFVTIGFIEGFGTTSEVRNYSFRDKDLNTGKYVYRLKQIDYDGTFEYSNEVEVNVNVVKEYSLSQNYPNPFNPSTKIIFSLASDSDVSLKIFNVLGQEVASLINGRIAAGEQSVNFNADGLNSGVYFYQIDATGIDGSKFSQTKKMILTK
ncbi:MAG: DUF4397 domain-containing protein [Ignavibacteriales bacterium]|nr:MAG: DUF4397 domain-containing protein [Ignavibacteriales bacterium]